MRRPWRWTCALAAAPVAALATAGTLSGTTVIGATVAPKALILSSTVSPGTATDRFKPDSPDDAVESLEQQQAEHDGFAVTLVTPTQWSLMKASDFAKYQVIIIGDPECDGEQPYQAAVNNESVWEPVVMRSGGNRVLIGTDATFHNNGPTGSHRGDLLEANGIAFAGAVSGATGAYIDTSCEYSDSDDEGTNQPPGQPVPIMDGLTTHGPHKFTAGGAPCAGAISIVAASGPTSGLHDKDLSNWSCSVHAFFDHFPSDWTPLALATDPTVPKIYSAKDVDTGKTVTGAPYVLVSGGGVTVSSNISLAPKTGTDFVGTQHTVTATIVVDGQPQSGKTVTFNVDTGPNTGTHGSGVTNAKGQTTFTYTGRAVGTDSISATFVDQAGALEKATASETWKAAPATPTPTPTPRATPTASVGPVISTPNTGGGTERGPAVPVVAATVALLLTVAAQVARNRVSRRRK